RVTRVDATHLDHELRLGEAQKSTHLGIALASLLPPLPALDVVGAHGEPELRDHLAHERVRELGPRLERRCLRLELRHHEPTELIADGPLAFGELHLLALLRGERRRVLGPAFLWPGLNLDLRHGLGVRTRPRAPPERSSAVDADGFASDEIAGG